MDGLFFFTFEKVQISSLLYDNELICVCVCVCVFFLETPNNNVEKRKIAFICFYRTTVWQMDIWALLTEELFHEV